MRRSALIIGRLGSRLTPQDSVLYAVGHDRVFRAVVLPGQSQIGSHVPKGPSIGARSDIVTMTNLPAEGHVLLD